MGFVVTVESTANVGNTGDGTFTLADPSYDGAVLSGTYVLLVDSVVLNGGTFTVTGPTGEVLPGGTIGTPYATQILGTMVDGAIDFIVGDGFAVAVSIVQIYDRLIPYPYGLEWEDWASTVVGFNGELRNKIAAEEEEDWGKFASNMKQFIQDTPEADEFDDWREWAESLKIALGSTSPPYPRPALPYGVAP